MINRWGYRLCTVHRQARQPEGFIVTEKLDLDDAKPFFPGMLKDEPLFSPAKRSASGAEHFHSTIKTSVDHGFLRPDPIQYFIRGLKKGIVSEPVQMTKAMPKVGGFRPFETERRTIAHFEIFLWLKKGGLSGEWTVTDQNGLLARLLGLQKVSTV
ncbi:DDE-type integrase/transposase/recombinase [Agrobacterium larrymoorei]|uniref:DDE-type integrase/transposase/recombinase n=1 Tax=Agrobacterium larrymoorei TaxID=160699 RepID=UPI0030BEE3A0